MVVRPVIAAAAVACLLAGSPSAQAALPPQIVDPTGDVKGAQASYDIVSVTLDTTKVVTTSKVGGRTVRTVTLKDFTVTMTLAGAPNVQPGTSYQIIAASGCGTFFLYTYWSAVAAGPEHNMQFSECGEDSALGADYVVDSVKFTTKGNSIVWSVPVKTLPKEIRANSIFDELVAYTAPTEPTSGYSGVDFAPSKSSAETVSLDYAATDKTYKFGS